MCSHEDTAAFSDLYRFLKDKVGKDPKFKMADGAKEISKANVEVFGVPTTSSGPEHIRLMCWSHVFRNVTPQLKSIQKINKKLAASLLSDIENLQWSVHNEECFRQVYDLLEKKYFDKYTEDPEKVLLQTFFQYFRKQWVDSPVFRWYEGAHPWHISNNQGNYFL